MGISRLICAFFIYTRYSVAVSVSAGGGVFKRKPVVRSETPRLTQELRSKRPGASPILCKSALRAQTYDQLYMHFKGNTVPIQTPKHGNLRGRSIYTPPSVLSPNSIRPSHLSLCFHSRKRKIRRVFENCYLYYSTFVITVYVCICVIGQCPYECRANT
jgi:hypothetical protein